MQTISEMLADLKAGNTTSVALTEQVLAQIEAKSDLNAFISVDKDRALQQAQAADEKRASGEDLPLLGVPISIKDNILVEGTKTTCASKILENFVAPYNATSSQRLLDAGAVLVGKTNMDQFAMGSTSETSFFGPTINPIDNQYTSGGSSSGSAAAVGAKMTPAALGTDTGGSIRQPAAYCGCVGIKPTYGRVSRYGLVSYASSLDQIGPIAQTVEDTALILNQICGHDQHDCTTSYNEVPDFTQALNQDIKGKVIGIPKEYFGEGLEPAIKEHLMGVLKKLEAKGAILKEISLPMVQHAISSYYIIATAEASSNLSRFDGVRYTHRSEDSSSLMDLYCNSRAEGFGEEVQRRILLGTFVLSSGYYDAYYMQAQKVRRLIVEDFQKAFEACDVIAAPIQPGAPLKVGEAMDDAMAMYLADIYNVSANMAGIPGMSIPVGQVDNAPISLQFFANSFDENNLFTLGSAVEKLD